MLREIHDPPGVLFVRGALQPDDALAIAIVGTRHGTQYGLRQAERLAGGLARAGLTIISGLARGIDAAAHRGALAAGGRTIAVLASGVLNDLSARARQAGRRGRRPRGAGERVAAGRRTAGRHVSAAEPADQRAVAGRDRGRGRPSGAGPLITARHAMEQGREVFAVPGNVDSRASRGCHQLIRDGAKLVESADDVLEELGPLVEAAPRADGQVIHHPAELLLNELEQQVLAAIAGEATSDRPDRRRHRPAGFPGPLDHQRVGNASSDPPAQRHDRHPAVIGVWPNFLAMLRSVARP